MTLLLAFTGFCLLFGAFVTDIKRHLSDLNDDISNMSAVNSMRFKKKLCDIIEFHCFTKQLSFKKLILHQQILYFKDFLIDGQIYISSNCSVSTFADGILCNVHEWHLFWPFEFE